MTIYDIIKVMGDTFIRVFGSNDNELFHFWSEEYFLPDLELPLTRLDIDSISDSKLKMVKDCDVTWMEMTDKGLDIYIKDNADNADKED